MGDGVDGLFLQPWAQLSGVEDRCEGVGSRCTLMLASSQPDTTLTAGSLEPKPSRRLRGAVGGALLPSGLDDDYQGATLAQGPCQSRLQSHQGGAQVDLHE